MTTLTLQTAVDALYHKAVAEAKSTSTKRLSTLAELCVQELAKHGLQNAETEATIDGGGRPKDWDVAWQWGKKYRLVLSLKSILKNLAGTVPNRIDDLMGETANIQLYSPEVVTGYVVIIDVGQKNLRQSGGKWCDLLEERLNRLAVRRAPYWTPSTFEAFALIRVDFSEGPLVLSGEAEFESMLRTLAMETAARNPAITDEA